jgi:hypothetical protein
MNVEDRQAADLMPNRPTWQYEKARVIELIHPEFGCLGRVSASADSMAEEAVQE